MACDRHRMVLSFTTVRWVGAVFTLGAGLVFGGVAYARDCNRAARDAAPASGRRHRHGRVEVDGQTGRRGEAGSRLDAAKRALRTVVDGLPDGARVGLRLYGHRVAGATRAEAAATPSSSGRSGHSIVAG